MLLRILIAAVFLVFMYLMLPLLWSLVGQMGVHLPEALLQLINLVIVAVALYYVFTGRPVLW